MTRRHFISQSFIILGCSPALSMVARASEEAGKTYPYGLKFGASGASPPEVSEIEKRVDQDDDWAKDDLVANGGDEVAMREAVRFGAYSGRVNEWRVAASLLVLQDNVNRLAAQRSKKDDGFIGDERHQTRNSDHNPWVLDNGVGVVTAFDITHNLTIGCDCNKIVDSLVDSKDPRIKYIIWNRQIINHDRVGNTASWIKRPYGGQDPHTGHLHLSVLPDKRFYDEKTEWKVRVT